MIFNKWKSSRGRRMKVRTRLVKDLNYGYGTLSFAFFFLFFAPHPQRDI